MVTGRIHRGLALSGLVGLAMAMPAQVLAQNTLAAPDYGSGASAGALSDGNFNTPESDGRPGVKFFAYAVEAFKKGDYRHAIDMYTVAASWAYKPAEYNLGVMYFKGQGILADRARGAAWMVLAAERGNPDYVKARDLMVTVLSKAEFKRTDEIWNQLNQKYGDKVALRRAKAQWALARTHQTGTRVGGSVGELRVGAPNGFQHSPAPPGAVMASARHGWTNVLTGPSTDGAVAYRQFQESSNPYDPVFLKNRTGTVTVEPLTSQKSGSTQPNPPAKNRPSAPPSSQPPRSI